LPATFRSFCPLAAKVGLAFGSFTAFSAPCANASLATVIATGSCTVGSTNQWTLSSWGLGEVSAFNYGANNNPTTANINVSFANLVSDGSVGANGALGFSVEFSYSGAGTDFFQADITGQTAAWQSFFAITNGSADTIKQVYNTLGNATSNGNAAVQINKFVSVTGQTPALGNVNIIHTNGVGPLPAGTVIVPGISGNTSNALSINDAFQVQSSSTSGTASAGFYRNSLFGAAPDQGVPEPMSFVLMGAGLVGIAALRRRNG